MKSHVLFKALVLGSVFSASLSYSALTLTGDDFKAVGLELEYSQAPQSVHAKLIAEDLDQGLIAAKKIDQLTNDPEATTSKAYLEQVLKALAAQDSGDVVGQDGETLKGFGNQIDRLMSLFQTASKLSRDYQDFNQHRSQDELTEIMDTLNWIRNNSPALVTQRKEMARVFWVRRVGYNPKHRDVFEKAWESFLNFKTIFLLVHTLETLAQDQEIQRVFGITPGNKPQDIKISRKLLNQVPSYLIQGFDEFNVPETHTFTFAQILALRDKYTVPYQTYWAGDNEDFSKPSAKIQEAAIDPLKDLGMDQEANRIFGRAMMRQARQMYLNEIMVRVIGRVQKDDPETPTKIAKLSAEIRQAERVLKAKWVEHVLGRQLKEGEEFPKEMEFQAFLKHLHIHAAHHFVFEKGELDDDSIGYLAESVQVRLAMILGRLQKIYDTAVAGNEEAFATVCSWIDVIDESKTELFEEGDKTFFDEYDGGTATEEDKARFAKILTGIYTVLGQKELADHPEYVVWKLATEKRPKEQIKQSLLLRIQGYEQQLEKDLFLSRNPDIKSSPLDLLPRDQDNVKTWESAPESPERTKLALGSTLEAAGRHALQVRAYSLIGGVMGILKEVKENGPLFVQMLTTQFDLFTNLMTHVTNKDKLLEQLGKLPHWVRTFNIFETIWKSISEKRRTAIQDIYKHGAVLKALKLQAQAEKRELREEEYKGHAEKVIAANQLLNSPLEMSSVVTAHIHQSAKGLSTYRMTKDMRYTSGLARLWWERRPAAEHFTEDKKRFDNVLMLGQFLELSTNTTLPVGTRDRTLEAIWKAKEHKPNIFEYM